MLPDQFMILTAAGKDAISETAAGAVVPDPIILFIIEVADEKDLSVVPGAFRTFLFLTLCGHGR